ncbi:hypothetical protein LCGC14_1370620, partial [marine sediment metagenome]
NKDDDKVTESDRAEALLGQWKYEAIMSDKAIDIDGDGTVNIDLFNTQEIRQCLKDNLTFFTEMGSESGGSYSINENGLACDDQDPFSTIEEDNYRLEDNSIIKFDNRNEMRIIQLTKSRLEIETSDNLGGEDVVVTITYKKG